MKVQSKVSLSNGKILRHRVSFKAVCSQILLFKCKGMAGIKINIHGKIVFNPASFALRACVNRSVKL